MQKRSVGFCARIYPVLSSYRDASIIPTCVPIHWLSRVSRSLAMKSAFCSSVVSYRLAFIAVTRNFPMSGICFRKESRHSGGVAALAVSLAFELCVGTLKSDDSGFILLGHSIDQSTLLGGRS